VHAELRVTTWVVVDVKPFSLALLARYTTDLPAWDVAQQPFATFGVFTGIAPSPPA
jgi:membrane protein required for beta-lactamase induction